MDRSECRQPTKLFVKRKLCLVVGSLSESLLDIPFLYRSRLERNSNKPHRIGNYHPAESVSYSSFPLGERSKKSEDGAGGLLVVSDIKIG